MKKATKIRNFYLKHTPLFLYQTSAGWQKLYFSHKYMSFIVWKINIRRFIVIFTIKCKFTQNSFHHKAVFVICLSHWKIILQNHMHVISCTNWFKWQQSYSKSIPTNYKQMQFLHDAYMYIITHDYMGTHQYFFNTRILYNKSITLGSMCMHIAP